MVIKKAIKILQIYKKITRKFKNPDEYKISCNNDKIPIKCKNTDKNLNLN